MTVIRTLAAFVLVGTIATFNVFTNTTLNNTSAQSVLPAVTFDECPEPDLICYSVRPSDTDGPGNDGSDPCPGNGIGCDDPDDPDEWGEQAINVEHHLYLPSSSPDSGKLLVFLGGGNGGSRGGENIYPVAARQGYHVVGLTYPAAQANSCSTLDCYGNAFREVVTGMNSPLPGGDETNVGDHGQDSIVNRLLKVLEWAAANKTADGWGRYLTGNGEVDWTKIHLAGMSNGSSHCSFMGTLDEFRDVGRIALFAGPDDGEGGTTEETWDPATYIQEADAARGSRYFGLVHVLNKANNPEDSVVHRVTKNWLTFGMEVNGERFCFDPTPGVIPDFGAAHMLISTDPDTDYIEAHESVAHDRDCIEYGPKDEDHPKLECKKWGDEPIGYEPAWRCILGTGHISLSSAPIADAGPNQTVECEGNGGANVTLDGSGTRDVDCGVLTYTWTGAFGVAIARKPTVFLPVGTHLVTLEVKDEWSLSDSKTVLITVQDTQPPSLQVTLTPTALWPANHKMVRVDAVISASDSCCNAPPTVVLTSITSNQPDNGGGDGSTSGDIQDAAFGTRDLSFLLRAERAGGDPRGRTYTVTYTAIDASGNRTQTSATVRVPHSR